MSRLVNRKAVLEALRARIVDVDEGKIDFPSERQRLAYKRRIAKRIRDMEEAGVGRAKNTPMGIRRKGEAA